jgi:hypothetical protein
MRMHPLVPVVSVCLGLALASTAFAQAPRTWVSSTSGLGDDANPCSRTAPCKTFAGAISKTAPGGEIDVLDPGGYGAVTITKSISIEADGLIAGVSAPGVNGIVINTGPSDSVTLRGLTIDGAGTGLNAVRFVGSGNLHIEKCYINAFAQLGVDFEPNGASTLFVRDSMISNVAGGAILVKPLSGSAQGSIENTLLDRNQYGVRAEGNAKMNVKNVTASNNVTNGFIAVTTSAPAVLTVDTATAINNSTNGVKADGAQAVVRLTNCTIIGNVTGMSVASGGQIISFGNNHNDGNGSNGGPTSVLGGS